MSAAELRSTAALIRERAEAATSGPWEVGDYWHIQGASHCRCDAGPLVWKGVRDINGTRMKTHIHRRSEAIGSDIMQADASSGDPTNVSFASDFGPGVEGADAEHIAAWDPTVALAFADLLDDLADGDTVRRPSLVQASALKAARAYLD